MRNRLLTAAVAATVLLAGCSGGGGGGGMSPMQTPATQAPGGSSTQSIAENSVSDTNSLGSPLQDFAEYDKSIDSSGGYAITSDRTRSTSSGTCVDGVEFFAPDKNGDTNSTETIDFYDSGCTIEARDTVRIYTPTSSSSETVAVTESLYSPGSSTAIATHNESRAITNAMFNSNGFAIAADGFDLVVNDTLNLAGSKTIISGRELSVAPASSGTNNFCSDSSGYNATGFPKLGETFGWQGGVLSGGTRTKNSDGSTTWTSTHAGTAFKGPIGGLSIVTGVQNTSCPISTPMFTLAGGTSTGTYSIPVVVTYAHGMLQSLTVTGATLSNGTTLNVMTNAGAVPTSPAFITGSISKGTTQLATFGVDAFGDGTLTVTATGVQFVIVNWHVVR